MDKWALSADIRFRPKAVVSHSVHFRFRRVAVRKFGGCQSRSQSLSCGGQSTPEAGIEPLASLCTDYTEEAAALSASASGTVGPCGKLWPCH